MKDSGQLADEWETANYDRAMHLNDMLDACADIHEKRALFQTFTKEEKNGLIPELVRRRNNEEAPTGSLVKASHPNRGISIWAGRGSPSVTCATHYGTATVLGHVYGSHIRLLLLQPPWVNREGQCIMFAEASIDDLEVV